MNDFFCLDDLETLDEKVANNMKLGTLIKVNSKNDYIQYSKINPNIFKNYRTLKKVKRLLSRVLGLKKEKN